MAEPKQVRCPTCKKVGDWFAGACGPFCSQRCRLIDLGQWLNEAHSISEPLKPRHFAPYADLPPGTDLDRPDELA